jgi:predicted esterase
MSAGLILLHGRGGSASDMAAFAAGLGLEGAEIAAPEAPGNSWWPFSFLAPASAMAPHLEAALATVDIAAAELEARGVPRGRIAVLGFSQGACLALEYAARQGAGLRAVACLSGGLIGTADVPGGPLPDLYGAADKVFDYDADLTGLPVLLTCHERDSHIPLRRVRDSGEVLRGLGARVQTIIAPGEGHSVTPDQARAAAALLQG